MRPTKGRTFKSEMPEWVRAGRRGEVKLTLTKLFGKKEAGRGRAATTRKAGRIMLAAMLAVGSITALPADTAKAAMMEGTPGGVDAAALRWWLEAGPDHVARSGNDVTVWQDSSGNAHDFVNDGSIAAISSRNKPSYVSAHRDLNNQPVLKFVRSVTGSILQDADGLFANAEEVDGARVFTVTGGLSSIDNSLIFNHSLSQGGFGAHIPHKSGSTSATLGAVLWDSGSKMTDSTHQRLTAGD